MLNATRQVIWKLKVRVFKDTDLSFLKKKKGIPSSAMTGEEEPELLA